MNKIKKRTSIFNILLFRILFIVILLNLVISAFQIKKEINIRKQNDEVLQQKINREFFTIIDEWDESMKAIEGSISSYLEGVFEGLIRSAEKADFKQIDLYDLLQENFLDSTNYDLYILEDGVVVNTTYPSDLGINLYGFGANFKELLIGLLQSGKFHLDRFTLEKSTHRLKAYCYRATKDKKYIIELGAYTEIGDYIMEMFLRRLENLITDNKTVSSVNIWVDKNNPIPIFNEIPTNFIKDGCIRESMENKTRVLDKITDSEKDLLVEYNYYKMEQANSIIGEVVMTVTWDRTGSKAPIIKAITWQVVILVAYILLLILVLVFAFRTFKLSLKDILRKTSSISKGNLHERVVVIGNNELTTLSEQFNEMVGDLEQSQDALIRQNKEITDSINYAKRIQSAVLPDDEQLSDLLPEYFVLFKPRDIVSGDYYWIRQIKNFTVLVAADCTGHGVPGAFMSMLGMSILNEIVGKSRLDSAGEFLDRLRKKVKTTLSQEGKEMEQKDGMDMSMAIFDSDINEVQFAGAFNPLYIIRKKGEGDEEELADNVSMESEYYRLFEIKGDRQPIAIYTKETDFKTHYIKLRPKDCLYMFSDGYPDQMGGPNGKKFMVRRFKELLLDIHNETMIRQKEILATTIEEWKKDVQQVDDILVMGIRWE